MKSTDVRLAMAPIGWTNDDMPDLGGGIPFEQCVSEMALSGYAGSEVGNKYPKDTHELTSALNLRGLQICNQWFSSFLTTSAYEEVEEAFRAQLGFLKTMGARVIGPAEQGFSIQGRIDIPVLTNKPCFSDEQWKALTDGLNKLGRIASDNGFRMCYHHHMGTGCQTMADVDRLLEATDPRYVWLLFDSGHFSFSGQDPVVALSRYIERVGHVHLKDVRRGVLETVRSEGLSFLDAVRAGVFTVPGDGDIDFPSIFTILNDVGYQGWMVVEAEQDPAKANPLEYALKAREYIRNHTGL